MARLIGPDESCRVVYLTSGTNKGKASAQGMSAPLYLDEALTTLADVLSTTGDDIAESTVLVDAYSKLPLVQYPDGVDTIYTSINGGPAMALRARFDDRLDALEVRATALEAGATTGSAALTAHAVDTTAVHGVADTSLLETLTGAQAKATAAQVAAISAAATDATTKANAAQAAAIQRANHTGTQSADTLTDGTTNKAFLATERTKLTGIATGATLNATDAALRDRTTHTGAQATSTVTGLDAALAAKVAKGDLVINPVDHGADPTGAVDSLAAFNLALAAAGSGRVQTPKGTFLLSATPTFSGRPCSFEGGGEGTLFRSTGTGPVLDFTGWSGSGQTVGSFRVEGSNTAGQTNNYGVKLSTPASQVGMKFHDIKISKTGGPGFDFGAAELADFERIVVTEPVGAAIHDVPYFVGTGAFNGNRIRGCGIIATSPVANMGASGAVVIRDNGSTTPHTNKHDAWWVEFLHPDTDQAIFSISANQQAFSDTQFFDCSKVPGATGTTHFRFLTPAVLNFGGNIVRGEVPGRDPGVATSIDAGVDLRQSRNLVVGPKSYRGTNVLLAAGVGRCYVHLKGSVSGADNIGFVDSSGTGTNHLIDEYNQVEIRPTAWTTNGSVTKSPDVQTFTATGTWTKPTGAVAVEVVLVGGGGGGGSGRKGLDGTVRCAGGAGAGGAVTKMTFPASALPGTVAVTVGSGGSGGASVTADSTNGNAGAAGVATTFAGFVKAFHGLGGFGGSATAGSGGTGLVGTSPGGLGASASATGAVGSGPALNAGAPGGCSGGGISSANAASNGGGATSTGSTWGTTTAGSAGVVGGAVPTDGGSAPAGLPIPGAPGGGGASSITGDAQAGANAGLYGTGGSGGGAAKDATGNSGAGGNGAAGIAQIVTYF
jgi:hypothetical protein